MKKLIEEHAVELCTKKTAAGAAVSLSQGNQFSNYKKVNRR